MSPGEYLEGVAYLCALASALGLGAVGARRRLLPGWDVAIARLAEAVLAIALLVVTMELLGVFGALSRIGLLVAVFAAGVGVWAVCRDNGGRAPGFSPPAPGSPRWAELLALGVAAIAVLHWSGGVQDSLDSGIYRQDSVWYHMPVAAGFFQSGDTWAIQLTDPMALTAWFYPMNSELLHAAGMLAFGNDFISPLFNIALMALCLLAAWCVGRPFGVGAATLIAVALVVDSDMMQVQAGNAPTDTAGVFFLLAAVAILVNGGATGREGRGGMLRVEARGGALLVAGLAAGLAVGTKITLLAPVGAITLGLLAIARRGERVAVGATWLGGLLATGGYWYLRNLAHAGNPLPWIAPGPLPGPDQLPLYPRPPRSVAEYAGDAGVWLHEFVPALTRTLGELWPLVLLAAAAGLLLAALRRPGLERVLGAAGIVAAIAYVFIPISASGTAGNPSGFETNLRYLAPAMVIGLALLPLVREPRGAWMRLLAPALALVFLVNALTSPTWGADQLLGGALFAIALLAMPLAATAARRRGGASRTVTVGAIVALTVAAAALVGYPQQRDYLQARYLPALAPPADVPGFRDTPQWRSIQTWARDTRDTRIAVVGPPAAFGQYVFYGEDLSNRVRYVGERGPHGAYLPIDDCVSWRTALNEWDPEYLVITPASAIGPGPLPQESLWTLGDPAAREILRAHPAAVYAVDGRLDPRGCGPEGLPPTIRVPGGGFGLPSTGFGPSLRPPPRPTR